MDGKDILLDAIGTYGVRAQTDMMIEEMSELTKALLKHRRAVRSLNPDEDTIGAIREEMADVSIVLDQMELLYGDYSEYRKAKLERLAKRIREDVKR